MDRQLNAHWMKDILEHLRSCYDQWLVADNRSEHYLVESMKRDLDEFRRLCDSNGHAEGRRRTARAA